MGFFSGSLKIVSNVVTLGGASRLSDAKASYQQSYDQHQRLCNETTVYKEEIEEHVRTIGTFLKATKPSLAKSEKILKKSTKGNSKLNFHFALSTLNEVERFNSEYNAAVGIGAGTVAGGSLAVGSWALVGTLGSASTGAAISGLSGAAATNATVAWFGGGALAAGGAGISGGMAMLGGIVAVPLICIASLGTHKKAKEFEEEKAKLDKTITLQQKHLDQLPGLLTAVESKKAELRISCEDFRKSSKRLIKTIRPFGILSAMKQKIFQMIGLKPINDHQIEALSQLNTAVTDFLMVFQKNTTHQTQKLGNT